MKIQIEHIIGVIIGLIPLVIISIVFRNDHSACEYYLWFCSAAAKLFSTLAGIIDGLKVVMAGNAKYRKLNDLEVP